MKRGILLMIVALCAALAAGAGAGWLLARSTGPAPVRAPVVVRDIVEVPVMAALEAASHRDERYARITTIEQTLALPGDFAQTEALYALAGRSDSMAVQDLIDQANRIADPTDRNAALQILFLRLAELDPRSALSLSRTGTYSGNAALEATIWRAWSKLDLAAALKAVKTIDDRAKRATAAQTILAAYGYTGSATTAQIEAELGIEASATSRRRYMLAVADRSLTDAFDYLNQLAADEQRLAVQWLAGHVARGDPGAALRYADLIDNAALRESYRNHVWTSIATHDPERVLAGMPDGALHGNHAQRYYVAMRTLAESDLDTALGYFDGIRSAQARRMVGNVIGAAMAREDPARALAWARAEDGGGQPALTMSVLTQLANTDPSLALAEATKLESRQWRRQSVSTVLSTVARTDPASAIAYLNEINDRQDRDMAMASIVGQWAGNDPEAAVDWLLSGDVPEGKRFLVQVGHRLISNDVDTAIRLLPRVDEQTSMQWRQQITRVLAMQRSPAEAARFVQQYAGKPEYDALRSTLISGVSQQDIGMARRLVQQLPAGQQRDMGYAQVIAQHSQGYPAEAASWLDSIADETVRSQTAAQVVRQWYGLEPQAASQWIDMQPPGPLRDNVIRHIAGSNSDSPREVARLIDSMTNPELRRQALTAQVYAVARTDPDAARLMLGRIDMPDEERRQVERQLDNMRLRATQYGLTY